MRIVEIGHDVVLYIDAWTFHGGGCVCWLIYLTGEHVQKVMTGTIETEARVHRDDMR